MSSASQSPSSRAPIFAAGALLVLAALLAYSNTFSVPFQFDDADSIVANATVHRLRPLFAPDGPLSPPAGGLTVSGRPLVNLSLALNYAIGGESVRGYHLFNLAVHALAGLALFGLVRRTLLRPPLAARFGSAALPIAFAIAALWTLHPLQTESVTYIVQRAESLCGLFYLLTFYAFVRGISNETTARSAPCWLAASFAACLLGMATKEVMASAPLLVFLYDRTFVAGSFRAAWHARRRYYLALAATWLLLGWLVLATGNRNSTAGLGTPISTYSYALTQCRAIVLYLKLCVWPNPLVFDYGNAIDTHLADIWPQALLLAALLAATAFALWRRPPLGFAGAWFFAILAPSSSFVPIATQTMAEHRMYLPLAAVITLLTLGAHALLGRRGLIALAVVAVVFGALTLRRNDIYRSDLALWSDVIAKSPANFRAYNDLGYGLSVRGRIAEAEPYYEEATRLQPDFADAHNNYGYALTLLNRVPEAIAHLEHALRVVPDYPAAHLNLGNALLRAGRAPEAIKHYRAALRFNPDDANIHHNLGSALLSIGRAREAIPEYQAALRLQPAFASAFAGLGYALVLADRPAEAIAACERALQLDPNFPDAHNHLGIALAETGRAAEAITHFEQALRLNPDFADAHNNLGNVLLAAGRIDDAIDHYERALRAKPGYADAERNLGEALTRAGHPEAAAAHFEAARRLNAAAETAGGK